MKENELQLVTQIDSEYRIVLKKHLYHKRSGEEKIRAWMFRRMWQFEAIIFEATRKGLKAFTMKGQTALIFSFKGEEYGMLVNIEKSPQILEGISKYDINIITIDKKDTRHYVEHDMFVKVLNKIYLNYELPMSHWNRYIIKLDSLKIDKATIPIYINERTRQRIANHLRNIKYRFDSIFSSIIHKNDAYLMKDSFWVKTIVDAKRYLIRVAIEQGQQREKNIILIDIRVDTKSQRDYINMRNQVVSDNEVNVSSTQRNNNRMEVRVVKKE